MGWLRIVASYWRERPWRGLGILALVISTAAYAGIVVHGQLVDASLENLGSDPTAHTGRVYFNTASGTAKLYNGTVWTGLGSGGAGAKNYVQNGYAGAGWASSSINISCNTVSSNLPDGTVGTALAVVATANGRDTCSYPFDLDAADANKKFSVQFDMNPIAGYAAGDMRVDICTCPVAWTNGICNSGGLSAAGCPPNSTRVVLSTDSSSVSALPNLTGSYRTTFDTSVSGTHYAMMIGLATTNTHTLNVSQLYAGPGVVTQGAAVSAWTSFTPTVNVTGTGTGTSASVGYWRRIGETMEVQGYFTPNGTSTVTVTASLPSGYTINTAALSGAGSTATDLLGHGFYDNSTNEFSVVYGTSTSVSFLGQGNATRYGGTSTIASGKNMVYRYTAPVNEWAGSGTVNVLSNGPDFACSTNGTWDAAGAAGNTLYGPAGCPISGTLTASRNKIVQWATPTSNQDAVKLQFEVAGTTQWIPAEESAYPIVAWPTPTFGAYISGSTSTTTTVQMEQYAQPGSTYNNATGVNWNASTYDAWRLVRSRGSDSVGFASATSTAAGLVSNESSGSTTAAGFTGARTISNASIWWYRVGGVVTVQWNRQTGSSCSAALLTSSAGIIPAGFRPVNNAIYAVAGQNNAADANIGLSVSTAGTMAFGTAGVNNFTNAANCGFYEGAITYVQGN